MAAETETEYHARLKRQVEANRAARQGKRLAIVAPQTLIQKTRQKKLAAAAAAAATPDTPTQGNAYELLLAQLFEHRRALHDVQSIERKIELKRAFLPAYLAWVDGVLAEGRGGDDIIVTTLFVWCMDVGEYDRALAIAAYVLQHGLTLPDTYKRTPAVTLIDEMADAALKGRMPADRAVELLVKTNELSGAYDAPDQARAKLHKALGYACMGKLGAADVDVKDLPFHAAQTALSQLQRALELFENVGVKKDIEQLERRVKAGAASSTA